MVRIAEVNAANSSSKHLVPNKVVRNSSGLLWYRADYELRGLRACKLANKRARQGILHAADAETFAIYSRELERWIERERILLRIPLTSAVPPTDGGKRIGPMRGLVLDEQPKAPPVEPKTVTSPSPNAVDQPKDEVNWLKTA